MRRLRNGGHAEDGDHFVADEVLDCAAVALDPCFGAA
jgi:hypothetical protein